MPPLNSTANRSRWEYDELACRLPWQNVQIAETGNSPTRYLSTMERATLRVEVPDVIDLPLGNSILHQAALRLSVFQSKGVLGYMSGYAIAADLQYAVLRTRWYRNPLRGWCLLAALDESGLVEVTLSTVDSSDRYGRYKRVRLADRLRELRALITRN